MTIASCAGKSRGLTPKKFVDLDAAKVAGFLRLMRPPNLPTAVADIIAGAGIGSFLGALPLLTYLPENWIPFSSLLLSSALLYAGGVVLNDVFDARLDQIERPERPIPSGLIGLKEASLFGFFLLLAGVVLALWVNLLSGQIALALAGSILFYDAVAKKVPGLGPVVMGLCRSLNLWMGISLLAFEVPWRYLWIPLVYIFAITTVSRSEVRGGGRPQLILAAILYAIVIFGVGILVGTDTGRIWHFIPYALIFAIMVFRPLLRALREPAPVHIRKAVKFGVIGIIALDAAWAAAYVHWALGLLVLALLPISAGLARRFAVT